MTRSDKLRLSVVMFTAVASVIWLVTLSTRVSLSPIDLSLVIFFACMVGFTLAYSVPVAGGSVSLMPLTMAGGFLILGLVPTAWAVALGTLIHGGIRYLRSRNDPDSADPSGIKLIEVTILNLAMHVFSLMAAGLVFARFQVDIPLNQVTWVEILAISAFIACYVGVNYTGAFFYLRSHGVDSLDHFVKLLPRALFYEVSPTVFSPLMPLIYTRIGVGGLIFYSMVFVVSSLIAYFLAVASARLERRVRELGSLQAVGQVLSANLDLEDVLSAIYEQVTHLITAKEFYVALYDAENNEVAFRYVVFNGQRVKRGSRLAANGLTEYVLRSRKPLLLKGDVNTQIGKLGIDHIGREARCWLGVPLIAGNQTLGIIAIQSYDDENAYSQSDLEVLATIASQAAVAVQNARLYSQTDEALTRRIQELDSVLRTTSEGVVLLDLEKNVLAANRAIVDLFGMTMHNISQQPANIASETGSSLFAEIQYSDQDFDRDCGLILDGTMGQVQRVVVDERKPQYLERTLTPVRRQQADGIGIHDGDNRRPPDEVTGWLLLFRDMTEEVELARLREDMTNMLVHDLRSPMTMVIGGLSLMPDLYVERDDKTFEQMVSITQRSSDRIMELINRLLDIGQLERGKMSLETAPMDMREILDNVITQYATVADESQITLIADIKTEVPIIYGDRSLLTRAFSNLMDNAVKFTPNGGVIRVWMKAEADAVAVPQRLLIGVFDNGPSIPKEAQGGLFEKFQQVSGIKGRRRGTGLGLPFCKLAIEAHEGRIWVDNSINEGCQFVVSLPTERKTTSVDDTIIQTLPLKP